MKKIDNNINNYNLNNNMSFKHLIKYLLFIFLLLISSINLTNATTFLNDQTSILNELNNLELQSTINPDIITASNSNQGYSISLTTKPIYLGFIGNDGNNLSLMQISYRSLGGNPVTKTFNLSSNSVYYIKFTPQSSNDLITFTLNNIQNSSFKYTIFNVNDDSKGFSAITSTMVNAMTDLININLGFWKLMYYLFILGIIIGGLGLLVSFGFKVYDWADDVHHKKNKIFHADNNNNNRRDRE